MQKTGHRKMMLIQPSAMSASPSHPGTRFLT
jgi:hypothetical protein